MGADRGKIAAAILTGQIDVVLAVGRVSHSGCFQPHRTKNVVANVHQTPSGRWVAVADGTVDVSGGVARAVTHAGMLLMGKWVVDALCLFDVAVFPTALNVCMRGVLPEQKR